MSARWPTRDELRKERRAAEAESAERQRAKDENEERTRNWEKYEHLEALTGLDLNDEAVRPILAAVRFLLERAR